jgi:amino acid permease
MDKSLMEPARPRRPRPRHGAGFSSVLLLNTMIGSGFLSMAFCVQTAGWPLFVVALAVTCFTTYLTSVMLLETGKAVNLDTGDMSEVVEKALGIKWRRVNDACNALICLGAIMSYFNAIGALGADALQDLRHDGGIYVLFATYPGFMVWTVLLFAAPFCFYREYGELEVASCSALGLGVVTCVSLVVAAFANPHAIPLYPSSGVASVGVLGNVLYAAVMQYAVFEMYAGLQDRDTPKGRGVVAHSVLGAGAILLIAGLAGCAATSSDVDANVLTSLNNALTTIKILYACVVLHLCFYIPNDFILGRLYAFRVADLNYLQVSDTVHYAASSLFLAAPLAVMAAIPRELVDGVFELILALTGEVPIALACFVIPCLAYRAAVLERTPASTPLLGGGAVSDKPVSAAATTATLVFAVVVLVVCPVCTIYQFVDDCVTDGCASYTGRRIR